MCVCVCDALGGVDPRIESACGVPVCHCLRQDILGHLWDPKHPAGSDHRARDKSKTLAVVPHQTAAPAKPWGVSQKAPADAGKHVVENDSEKLEEKLLKAEDIIDTTLSTIHLAEVTKTAAFAGEAMNKIGLPYDLKNLVKGLGASGSWRV